jgi:hypothetical protein
MEPTLDAALTRIFGGTVTTTGTAPPAAGPGEAAAPAAAKPAVTAPDNAALIREASQHYDRALQLERQGDWAGYGVEIKKLGEVLNKLAASKK